MTSPEKPNRKKKKRKTQQAQTKILKRQLKNRKDFLQTKKSRGDKKEAFFFRKQIFERDCCEK